MSNEWVHCNMCYTLPEINLKFYLTACGRIFCQKCAMNALKDKCVSCGATKCGAIEINSQMKGDTKNFFMDPLDVLKRQNKLMISILEYQKTQRNHIFVHFKTQQRKMQQLVKFVQDEAQKRQILSKENSSLKEQIRQLTLALQQNKSNQPQMFVTSSNDFRAPVTPQTMSSGSSVKQTPFNTARPGNPHSGLSMLRQLTPNSAARNTSVSSCQTLNVTMNTPRMLGLDKNIEKTRTPENPYLKMWPKNQSPMHGVSPRGGLF